MRRLVLLLIVMAACKKGHRQGEPGEIYDHPPTVTIAAVAPETLCVTRGALATSVEEPTVRAFAKGTAGDAAGVTFKYEGESHSQRVLASGQDRHQVGLKLRTQDSCNLVYVMWRTDAKFLDVSVKHNPGMKTHAECGANGYKKVKTKERAVVPTLETGGPHTLRAEIIGDDLTAWIDDHVVWHGTLPPEAREIAGPAGFRSDNVALSGVQVLAAAGNDAGVTCTKDTSSD